MTNIKYVKGDATNPLASGTKIICYCCNAYGEVGKALALALSKK